MPTGKKQTKDHKDDNRKPAGSDQKQAKSASGTSSSSTKGSEKNGGKGR